MLKSEALLKEFIDPSNLDAGDLLKLTRNLAFVKRGHSLYIQVRSFDLDQPGILPVDQKKDNVSVLPEGTILTYRGAKLMPEDYEIYSYTFGFFNIGDEDAIVSYKFLEKID